jgi:uncharacterized lipoprotein YajG
MKLKAAVKMSLFTKPPQDVLKSRKSEQLLNLQYLDWLKFNLEQATEVQMGSRGIALLFL